MHLKVVAAFLSWLAVGLWAQAQSPIPYAPAPSPQTQSATSPLPPPLMPAIAPPRAADSIPDVERPEISPTAETAWVTPPDDHRLWFTADYLLWWVKGAPMPQPLLTSGSSGDAIPGALGQPHTKVLFGQHDISFMPSSGARIGVGDWLDAGHVWAIELGGFLLAHADRRAAFSSGGDSDLMYARPYINPATGESAYAVSLNGQVAGTTFASTSTQLAGWELNGIRNVIRNESLEWNVLGGFREVYLRETLTLESDSLALQPGSLYFAGQSLRGGDQVLVGDHFRAANVFYGLQLGSKLSWSSNRFGVDAVGKVALGVVHESVAVYGDTTYLPANSLSGITIPGGLLAQSSNIGRYSRERFAAVPEFDLNIHYDLATWARLDFGYSFIYLSRAVQTGLVVDRTVDPGRIPSNVNYGSTTISNSPGFLFQDAGFWAQGLNLGITFRY